MHDKYDTESEMPGTSFYAHEGIGSLWMSADGKWDEIVKAFCYLEI